LVNGKSRNGPGIDQRLAIVSDGDTKHYGIINQYSRISIRDHAVIVTIRKGERAECQPGSRGPAHATNKGTSEH
jgi:hypothetical protein